MRDPQSRRFPKCSETFPSVAKHPCGANPTTRSSYLAGGHCIWSVAKWWVPKGRRGECSELCVLYETLSRGLAFCSVICYYGYAVISLPPSSQMPHFLFNDFAGTMICRHLCPHDRRSLSQVFQCDLESITSLDHFGQLSLHRPLPIDGAPGDNRKIISRLG